MIKGWKNNPAWVVYNETKKERDIQRQIERIKTEYEMRKLATEVDTVMSRMTNCILRSTD